MEYIISRAGIIAELIGNYGLLAGILLIIMVLLRQLGHRRRRDAQQQKQREVMRQAAHESERKKRMQTVIPKSKVILPQTRVPLGDPFGVPFTGAIQGNAAKWEAEIHQLGRQIIGQIDCKMAALQAVTLEANRTANRLEILVEHLEQIARKQIEQLSAAQNTVIKASETPSTVIPVTESEPEAAPLAEVLKEIDGNLKDLSKTIRQSTTFSEQIAPATVLRLAELQAAPADSPKNLRGEVEMLANYGVEPQEIAQRLNLSLGEVDVILQVRQNQS